MFVCDKCSIICSPFKSLGICEICGRTGVCSDVHHSKLNINKLITKKEEK